MKVIIKKKKEKKEKKEEREKEIIKIYYVK